MIIGGRWGGGAWNGATNIAHKIIKKSSELRMLRRKVLLRKFNGCLGRGIYGDKGLCLIKWIGNAWSVWLEGEDLAVQLLAIRINSKERGAI